MEISQAQLNGDVKIPPKPLLLSGEGAAIFIGADEGALQRSNDFIMTENDKKEPSPQPSPVRGGSLRVALVHDFLVYPGGAERVLEVLSEMFPAAPIYTLLYNKERMGGKFQNKEIHPSFLQKFPKFLRRRHRWLMPFMPVAPETFDLREFDLVISSSGAWSKGIITRLNTTHIAYVHSPMRFVWDYPHYADEILNCSFSSFNFWKKILIRPLLNYLRLWDRQAAERPDCLIANSQYTQKRIKKYYRQESVIIYPPVDIKNPLLLSGEGARRADEGALQGKPSLPASLPRGERGQGKHFIVVSRLSPYKKVDLVVEAFNKLGLPLVIIGTGEQEKYLRKIAAKNIRILGWQSEEKVRSYLANARAFIFPPVDDFGLAPVEAMSHGVPVIAYRAGGAQETIIEGVTGEFFNAQTPEVLADGVRRFMEKEGQYDTAVIEARAKEFSKERFVREFGEYINANIRKC